jgi:hypothetical protein
MELKINECDKKQVTVLRIGLRQHSMVDRDLGNIYREFEEASKFTNMLCPNCELDESLMEIFIEFVS